MWAICGWGFKHPYFKPSTPHTTTPVYTSTKRVVQIKQPDKNIPNAIAYYCWSAKPKSN